MNAVVLGLGSNKSFEGGGGVMSPAEILKAACAKLDELLCGAVFSSVYVTSPMYVENQCDFYNMVVGGLWSGTPQALLEKTQAIEAELGRDRRYEIRNGPRTLDIDIELFGGNINSPDDSSQSAAAHCASTAAHCENSLSASENLGSVRICTPELTVPHPRLLERSFVLVPLLEILGKRADKTERECDAFLAAAPDAAVFKEAQANLPDQGVRYYGRIYGKDR